MSNDNWINERTHSSVDTSDFEATKAALEIQEWMYETEFSPDYMIE